VISRAFILFCILYFLCAYKLYLVFQPINAVTVALAVAITGFFLQIYIYVIQKKYEKSAFRLESALDTFEETHKLLEDKNNDRVKWVTAARALQRGVRIASGITEQVHKDVLEVHRDRYRLIFGDILGYDNPDITAAFFYGAPDHTVDIKEAAEYSSKKKNNVPQVLNLDKTSLKIIWDFAKFPSNYKDPISDVKPFSSEEVDDSVNIIIFKGLFDYLRHRRDFNSLSGKVTPRSQPKPEPVLDSVWWKKFIKYFSR